MQEQNHICTKKRTFCDTNFEITDWKRQTLSIFHMENVKKIFISKSNFSENRLSMQKFVIIAEQGSQKKVM